MPTSNPRIYVSLSPASYATVTRLGELTHTSRSAVIGELLDAAMPVFTRTVKVLETAAEAKRGISTKVAANLEEAEALVFKQLGLVMDDLEDRTGDLVAGLEAIQRRAPRKPKRSAGEGSGRAAAVPARAVATPFLTGGSGHPPKNRKHSQITVNGKRP